MAAKTYYGAEPEKTTGSQIIKIGGTPIAAGNKVTFLGNLRDTMGYDYETPSSSVSTTEILESLVQDPYLDNVLRKAKAPKVNTTSARDLLRFCTQHINNPDLYARLQELVEWEEAFPFRLIRLDDEPYLRETERSYIEYVTQLEHTRALLAEHIDSNGLKWGQY